MGAACALVTALLCAQPVEFAGRITVLVFVRHDCPISNRYAPELRRLHKKYAPKGVAFRLVYVDEDQETIRGHLREYAYGWDFVQDPDRALVRLAKARVTPEAAIFGRDRQLLYHGRIDDQYVELGRARRRPTTHDLESALEAVLAGRKVAPAGPPAVGCSIRQ